MRNKLVYTTCGSCSKPTRTSSGFCFPCRTRATLPKRLWSRVNKDGAEIIAGSRCWEWTGHVRPCGYGYIWFQSTYIGCNRAAMIVTGSPPASGQNVLHKCDNSLCCNPEHLYLGTLMDNARDRVNRGRSTTKARLSPARKAELLQCLGDGVPYPVIKKTLGITLTTIRRHQQKRKDEVPNATTPSEGDPKP